MARVEGAEIVWTSADLDALQADKNQLQGLINQLPVSPGVELRTEFQDPCPAFVRWVVSNSNDNQSLRAPRSGQTRKEGKAPAKGKKPRKR
jgi:hypothetical protein